MLFYLIKFFLWIVPFFFNNCLIKDNRSFCFFIIKSKIIQICFFLKYNSICLFSQIIDMTAIDLLGIFKKKRFMLNYEFLSLFTNQRLTIQFFVKENIFIESISNFYNSVEWSEREIWDMFGIFFTGHFELRRLLTDYGFTSFPLRKEFPVGGFLEIFYDDSCGATVFEKPEFMQEMRKLIPML